MVLFFKGDKNQIIAVDCLEKISENDIEKLEWLFSGAKKQDVKEIKGFFVGPRKEMITPWSTNAVEITQNMRIEGISRIEEFFEVESKDAEYDSMLQVLYTQIGQDVFTINHEPEPIIYIDDIESYNKREGLALNPEEVKYLKGLSKRLGRKLTDSEVFGFSQVNSEHCRHKIFNGVFIIDGKERESSLFKMIKRTSQENPNYLVSAYKDNVAFFQGPIATQFAPASHDKPDYFTTKEIETVLSLKAETHNFPTTVEPFNGAATGSGGEIRDRLGGGKASLPLAGTAVYMTSYPRTEKNREWEKDIEPRKWLYQSPEDILIKASNGASDFGNKFGQPLICGSLFTFEHIENQKKFAYDKVIMMAGGVGFAKKKDAIKNTPNKGDKVVIIGGDNYRIGMGGGAVSSVATGEYDNSIELNAVQRSNPEMQKRAMNAIRAMAESDDNPIISIHDHGAGGHLNCLSELVEETGGTINIDKLPIGDKTLSHKEIAGNESQERMGLVLNKKDIDRLKAVADRERAPMYVVGEATGDMQFVFKDEKGNTPINWQLSDMFGNPPKTIMNDVTVEETFKPLQYDKNRIEEYLQNVLQLEAVACKDWLTNKVDRSVTGKVAKQQCAGELQLPLNDLGATAIDYNGTKGIATSIGHAPAVAMIDAAAGSVLSIAESLTNIVWAPLTHGLKGVSLSANWMWPCKNKGEDARLYNAVEAAGNFAVDLGINIPTGKDSLSMTQKYPDGDVVYSPGTVIISAAAEVSNIKNIVEPVLVKNENTKLIYIDLSSDSLKLGGSSFAQAINYLGDEVPTVTNTSYFKDTFNTIQELIDNNLVLAGHDISAGGIVTTLLEMCFSNTSYGISVDLNKIKEDDIVKVLFAENSGVVIQVEDVEKVTDILESNKVVYAVIGEPTVSRTLNVVKGSNEYSIDIDKMRSLWFKSSYLLDKSQSGEELAKQRYDNFAKHALKFSFNKDFSGKAPEVNINRPKAAIIREKGVNGDREMAYSMYLAGFDVKDVHMTDLISGREDLSDVNFIVFVGGFSNSDVLGSAKGWAGAFLYNPKAKAALDAFYKRQDTMSLGVCNGCQLMVELGLVTPNHSDKPKMLHNNSHKFESGFITMDIQPSSSIMMKSLEGSTLGVWIAHGEGKFYLPEDKDKYNIAGTYAYNSYPANPNGSDYNTAALCSDDGRHLAMMPHLERAIFPWQWANYPSERKNDEVTPWIEAFVNAKKWIEQR